MTRTRVVVGLALLVGCGGSIEASGLELQEAVGRHIAEERLSSAGQDPLCLKTGRWDVTTEPEHEALIPASSELIVALEPVLPHARTGDECGTQDNWLVLSEPEIEGSSAWVGWMLWMPRYNGGAVESCWLEDDEGEIQVTECRQEVEY